MDRFLILGLSLRLLLFRLPFCDPGRLCPIRHDGDMKKNKQLILAFFLLLVLNAFVPAARAYEQDQLADCISSARENTALKGVSESSIENYCDCALDSIVDQGKDIRDSGYECAIKNFG